MPSTSNSTPACHIIAVLCLVLVAAAPAVTVNANTSLDADGANTADMTTCAVSPGATAAQTADSENLSVETFAAPADEYDQLTNASAIARANRTDGLTPASVGIDRTWEDEAIAYRDTIVHRIGLDGEATGLLDRLAAPDRGSPTANFRALVGEGEIGFEYTGATACPPTLALNASIDRGAFRVVPDRGSDALWLVLDADRLLFYPLGEGEPTTDTFVRGHHGFSLTLRESSGLVAANASVRNDYQVEEARVEFAAQHDGLVRTDAARNQSLRGLTLLAPGNEVTVVLHPYTADASAIETTVTVNSSRGFTARVDLSNAEPGATYAVAVPGLTESPAVAGGGTLVAVGNATTALLTVENQTSTGTVLYGTSLTTTDGGFVTVRNESGELLGVSEYREPGRAIAQPDLSPALRENTTVSVTVYRDANGNREFDDADVPYRASGEVVRDTAVVRLEDDEERETTETTTSTTTVSTTTATETTATASTAIETDPTKVSGTETSPQPSQGVSGFGVGPALVALLAVVIGAVGKARSR